MVYDNSTSEYYNWEDYTEDISERFFNFTDKITDYLEHDTPFGDLPAKWGNFSHRIANFFKKYHKSIEHKDIPSIISKFNKDVTDYFKKYLPKENVSELLDRFQNKMSRIIGKKSNITDDVVKKVFDFTSNITDYLTHGKFGQGDGDTSITKSLLEQFDTFFEKITKYFKHANITDFNKYVIEIPDKKNVRDTVSKDLYFFKHYHQEEYPYDEGHERFAICTDHQKDKCHHKCLEKQQELCGCYIVMMKKQKDTVDCVCANSLPLCYRNHTHTELKR